MNKLNVLAKNPQTYFIKRLSEEVGEERLNIINPWAGDSNSFSGDLWVRTTAVYGSEQDLIYCRHWDGRVINPMEALELFRTKSHQYAFYQKQHLPHLPWILLTGQELDEVMKITMQWGDKLLLKPDRGQGGWGIKVISRSELPTWWQQPDHEYLLQPFIEDKKEFRNFFCWGEKPIVLQREGGVAANFAQGGRSRLSSLPDKATRVLEELVAKSGALYGAIDCFLINDELSILELNVCPGLEQLESVTGQNILRKLLRNLSP